MVRKNFEQVWDQLRAKGNVQSDFLTNVTITNFRSIRDLSVMFRFPVSVLAGPNASGKITVLLACACAYRKPGSQSSRDSYSPAALFPNLTLRKHPQYSDAPGHPAFEFLYIHPKKPTAMRWARGAAWSKSYMGQSGGEQPERHVYLRTLANLTNPAEVRSVLQIGQKGHYTLEELTSDLIAFAQWILPLRYDQMVEIRSKAKNLLFALRPGADTTNNYSEFHMSAGERAILRLSKDLSRLKNALVLIDEIEAGLHPFTQQMLMLELLRLAVRNDLQIIVTTHSPVVLECVPVEGRIFLERRADNVVVLPAYRDVIQKALYGQSIEKLSILCEDDVSESLILGVLDVLNPKLGLLPSDIVVGRDTGKDQFSQHIEALGKFKQLGSFVFVLDGDGRHLEEKLVKIGEQYAANVQPLFLPGNVPEEWAWKMLRQHLEDYAPGLGLQNKHLLEQIEFADRLFSNATDHPNNIIKNKYFSFCEQLKTDHLALMRTLARQETQRGEGDIKIFADQLESQIRRWQARR